MPQKDAPVVAVIEKPSKDKEKHTPYESPPYSSLLHSCYILTETPHPANDFCCHLNHADLSWWHQLPSPEQEAWLSEVVTMKRRSASWRKEKGIAWWWLRMTNRARFSRKSKENSRMRIVFRTTVVGFCSLFMAAVCGLISICNLHVY